MRKIAFLLAAALGFTMVSVGAAHAGVDAAGDRSDRHAWVTTKGELKQIKPGMPESKVERILDGEAAHSGSTPSRTFNTAGGTRALSTPVR